MEYKLPKFGMYVPIREAPRKAPDGLVTAVISERVNRLIMWAQDSFNYKHTGTNPNAFHAAFVSLRDGQILTIDMTTTQGGQLEIRSDNMELVGDMIQDLCTSLEIKELKSTADFQAELEEFNKVLMNVDGYNAVRIRLTMEMADSSQVVKALVIRAEDARILSEMALMRQHYNKLHELNSQLIGEYIKRANNHTELLSALREVNAMIQKAAKLRMGQV